MSDAPSQEQLESLGEEEVVRRLVAGLPMGKNVLVGAGDDCAVVDVGGDDLLLLKTDAVVAGVHFLPETEPERVGWKAAARVVSDFAAMGGSAHELMVTLAASGNESMAWVEGLYRGLVKCAERYGASIVGGETVSLPDGGATLISISGTGRVPRNGVVTRGSGRVDDDLWVTGRLGGSFESERHLDFLPRAEEGKWLGKYAHAMMDLSDGLRRDLPRLARASGCGFVLEEECLPLHDGCTVEQALGDGEDMELLLAAPAGDWVAEFQRVFPTVGLTRIGRLTAEGEGDLGSGGWQHFNRKGKESK
ncbi:thiamine-phosphate kinase [Roseibacillus persicicus]|uniref:thiamine-phosphate kinase n=1 Tax=Roseibacillus persicicus TaxID=454148 RepID=UPI00398AC182